MTFRIRKAQNRIALLAAVISMALLATLALLTHLVVRQLTFKEIDEQLRTLSIAIASGLEMEGLDRVEQDVLNAGIEANRLAYRLEHHSAILLNSRGEVILSSGDLALHHDAAVLRALTAHDERPFTAVEPFSGQHLLSRFRIAHLGGASRGSTLVLFRSIEPNLRVLERLDSGLVAFVLLGVFGSTLILMFAVRRAIRPVEAVTEVAETLQASDLSLRVPDTGGGEEFRRLIAVINSLLERLERAFQSQSRLIIDAAHELKTPAAILLAEAQEAARPDTPGPIRQEALDVIVRTSRALGREVDDLLALARSDISESIRRERVDLSAIARQAVDRIAPVATGRDVKLRLDAAPSATLTGDPALLLRMVINLVRNAVVYSVSGGDVVVEVSAASAAVSLRVSDRGPGIPVEDRARILDRFVRLPEARRIDPEGSGLGLAIVDQVLRQHGASMLIDDRPGGGSVFVINLPADSSQVIV